MHFNLTRFWWLFQKHTAEHYRYYLMAVGVLLGAMGLVMGFLAYIQEDPFSPTKQAILFAFLLLGAGTVFTSTVFSDLGDKKKAIAALTLPASHFEKYVVAWVYSWLFFQLVFLACFYFMVKVIMGLDDWNGPQPELLRLTDNGMGQQTFLLFYTLMHAVAFFGSVFFEKWHFIKTAFVFFLFMVLLMFLNLQVMELVLGRDLQSAFPFSNLRLMEGETYFNVRFDDTRAKYLSVVPLGLAVILWVTSFFKLQEKEI